MIYPDDKMAPGCYGSALTYREGSQECDGCPFSSACGPLSMQRREAMRARLGIEIKEKKIARRLQTNINHLLPSPELTLPKKVEAFIQRFERMGIKITEKLAAGENPFDTTPRFMRVACHVLLHMPGGTNRKTLAMALVKKLDWTEGTAQSHAGVVAGVLVAIGAATEDNGILKLKRQTCILSSQPGPTSPSAKAS